MTPAEFIAAADHVRGLGGNRILGIEPWAKFIIRDDAAMSRIRPRRQRRAIDLS